MYVGEVESVGNPVNTAILSLQQADPSVGKSDEQIVLQIQTPTNPYKLGGTFEGWQNSIAKLAEGNSRLILVLCAAFAAPLLQLVGHENFGINIAGKSSSGKSTAIVAAVSVWGKGSTDHEGYARSWNSTSNGLEGVATMHNDTLLALDEMGQASARTVSEAAYMLGNGIGKSRARTDGSAKIARRWRTVLLSSGEKGVAEKISDDGGQVQAGQLVRIIEILADADSGLGLFEDLHGRKSAQAFADEIKQAAATHHGHAARAFIKAIQADTERVIRILTEALPSKLKDLLPTDSADGEVRRVASHFSLLAIASELAIDFGIVNWSKDTPFKAIKACFDAWLLQRGGIGSAEDTAMLEKAKRLLITHGESRFQDINADVIGTIHNRLGFKRDVFDDQTGITITEYYMPPEIFKKEISSNKNVPPLLCKHGLLRQGDGAGRRGYTRKPSVQLPGLGYKRCYVLVLPDEYHHSESDDPAEAKQILDEAIMFNKAMQEDDVIIELDEVLS
jgi:putative DNA primase/helicase